MPDVQTAAVPVLDPLTLRFPDRFTPQEVLDSLAAAEAARDEAQTIAQGATVDGAVAALVDDPDSATRAALSSTIESVSAAYRAEARGRWPVVSIDLDGGADPTTKDIYIPGTYTITDTDGGVLHSGAINLRGRGNSTWGAPQKPWRINFGSKTAPLGMTANQKNWALLAEYYDALKISNVLSYLIGAQMDGLTWTPETRTVELVLNGTYRGLYDLADLVRLESGRLEGGEPSEEGDGSDGTWLLEAANKEGPGGDRPLAPGFDTSVYSNWLIWDTPEEPTEDQQTYIAGAFTAFEAALSSGNWAGWQALADATSFADWYLMCETFSPGYDAALGTSCKLWKSPDDGETPGKIHMGPLWDFDLGWGTGWNNTPAPYNAWRVRTANWFARMWEDASWRVLLQARWAHLLSAIEGLGGIPALVDRYADARERARRDDHEVWDRTIYTPLEADRRKRYILARIAWLGSQITAPIDPVTATVAATV